MNDTIIHNIIEAEIHGMMMYFPSAKKLPKKLLNFLFITVDANQNLETISLIGIRTIHSTP